MRLFSKQVVGVDVDARSIEVVALGGNGNAITHAARTILGSGLVENGLPKDSAQLSKALRETLKNAKPEPIEAKDVYATLPDSVLFTTHFEIQTKKDEDKADQDARIVDELAKKIPFRIDEVLHTYQVVGTEGGFLSIVAAVASKEHVAQWVSVYRAAGLRVGRFDIELIAQYRAIFSSYPKEPVLIIDMGATRTSFGLFSSAGIEHTHTISVGGADITTAIAETLKISEVEAEKAKKQPNVLAADSKTFAPTIKVLENIHKKVVETVEYYKTDKNIEVTSIVTTGGTSNLAGVSDYLQENIGITVEQAKVADAFIGKGTPKTITHHKNRVVYVEAIGAALLGKNGARPGDLLITPSQIRSVKKVQSKKEEVHITSIEEGEEDSTEKKEEPKKKEQKAEPVKPQKRKWWKLSKLEIEIGILGLLVIVGIFGIWWAVGYREDRQTAQREQDLLQLQQTLQEYAEEQGTTFEELAETAVESEEEEEVIPQLEILDTPTGWLRVRSGPGTEYRQVEQVNTGEIYPLIDEEAGWYNIDIAEDLNGWVFSEYAQVLESATGASEEEE